VAPPAKAVGSRTEQIQNAFFQIAPRCVEPAMVQGEHLGGFGAAAQPSSVGCQIFEGGIEITPIAAEPGQGRHASGTDLPLAGAVKDEAVSAQTGSLNIQRPDVSSDGSDL
jgi:hypothetical protein